MQQTMKEPKEKKRTNEWKKRTCMCNKDPINEI